MLFLYKQTREKDELAGRWWKNLFLYKQTREKDELAGRWWKNLLR
jgi:hypothetical protein